MPKGYPGKQTKADRAAVSKKYYLNNKEYFRQKKAKWYLENRDKVKLMYRKQDLKKNHRLTIEQYAEMLNRQEGQCKGCQRHYSEFNKSLAVDHNHKTGKIRGLLCGACNKSLGLLKEDLNIFYNLIKYLQEHN